MKNKLLLTAVSSFLLATPSLKASYEIDIDINLNPFSGFGSWLGYFYHSNENSESYLAASSSQSSHNDVIEAASSSLPSERTLHQQEECDIELSDLEYLPLEVLYQISNNLDKKDYLAFTSTSKRLRKITEFKTSDDFLKIYGFRPIFDERMGGTLMYSQFLDQSYQNIYSAYQDLYNDGWKNHMSEFVNLGILSIYSDPHRHTSTNQYYMKNLISESTKKGHINIIETSVHVYDLFKNTKIDSALFIQFYNNIHYTNKLRYVSKIAPKIYDGQKLTEKNFFTSSTEGKYYIDLIESLMKSPTETLEAISQYSHILFSKHLDHTKKKLFIYYLKNKKPDFITKFGQFLQFIDNNEPLLFQNFHNFVPYLSEISSKDITEIVGNIHESHTLLLKSDTDYSNAKLTSMFIVLDAISGLDDDHAQGIVNILESCHFLSPDSLMRLANLLPTISLEKLERIQPYVNELTNHKDDNFTHDLFSAFNEVDLSLIDDVMRCVNMFILDRDPSLKTVTSRLIEALSKFNQEDLTRLTEYLPNKFYLNSRYDQNVPKYRTPMELVDNISWIAADPERRLHL